MRAALILQVEDSHASLQEDTVSPTEFAAAPASWYYLGSVAELARGPLRFALPGSQTYVGYRTNEGRCVVLTGRCSHMGADLSKGCVSGDKIACPLHGWEYGPDGACTHVPAATEIPDFARQGSFPVEERGGHVFFFNRPQARFALPFFEGVDASQLLAARRFEFVVDAPWYLVSANGFDAQHYRCAHDRTLDGDLVVDSPNPFARRLRADFTVSGTSLQERLTRRFSGSKVNMTVTNWGGNLVLVTAKFRRTTSYGIVSFVPMEDGRTLLRDIVWIPRRRSFIAQWVVDPIDAEIRRSFIREFVRSDIDRSQGIRFNRNHTISADRVLVEYLDWLQKIHR
ncbi:MAG: Rieske 2Fe-2S domain-containing protein [Chthoniobacterales bacterium]